MATVGAATGSAPARVSARARSSCESAGRVISTRLPKSGNFSNHATASRKATTVPTITIAGALNPSRSASPAIVASVPVTVRCEGRVPFATIAAG